jgi:hypothetical protein
MSHGILEFKYEEEQHEQYGFWWSYVEQVIYRYLDCGDLHNRFASFNKMLTPNGNPQRNSKLKSFVCRWKQAK